VCPVEAIMPESQIPAEDSAFVAENARFFTDVLPGRTEPLGSPGGARKIGVVGVDTAFVQNHDVP
jgi:hypothetical protein